MAATPKTHSVCFNLREGSQKRGPLLALPPNMGHSRRTDSKAFQEVRLFMESDTETNIPRMLPTHNVLIPQHYHDYVRQ